MVMKEKDIKKEFSKFVLPTYHRQGPVFVKGKGSFLWDIKGRKYLDLFPGWGVGILGHSHPRIARILAEQAKKLIHIPNNLYHPYQAALAREIVRNSFKAKVFFANSGAEAVEAALKLARAYGRRKKRYKIITMRNSFHGRTLGALSATAQDIYQRPFRPLLGGFKVARFGSRKDLKKKIDKYTVAVIMEPIQGEGGVNLASSDYFSKVREICTREGILLIFDEIQTGMGRTGKMFAFQHYDIKPDVFTVSKGLGAGFPISALVVKDEFSGVLSSGMHASTFGGSPLACCVALEVFKIIKEERILEEVNRKEKILKQLLFALKEEFGFIKEVRGKGLMWAMELKKECASIFEQALAQGLIINCTHKKIIRILPALNIETRLLEKGISILRRILKERGK